MYPQEKLRKRTRKHLSKIEIKKLEYAKKQQV